MRIDMASSINGYGSKKYYKGSEVIYKFKSNGNWYYSCIYPKEKVITNVVYTTIKGNAIIEDDTIEDRLGGSKEYLGN